MIKAWGLFFLLISGAAGFAAENSLKVPADISFVSSKDGPYDMKLGNAIRHRVSVKNALGGEGSQFIVFEKFAPGGYDSPDKVIFQKEIAVTSLPKVKEFVSELAKKSVEATYGCCNVKDVSWNDFQVQFKVQKDSKSFACETAEFSNEKFKVSCK